MSSSKHTDRLIARLSAEDKQRFHHKCKMGCQNPSEVLRRLIRAYNGDLIQFGGRDANN